MWSMTCPICLTTLYKEEPVQPWICPQCGWRSDEQNGHLKARLLHLTDSFPLG